MADGWLLVPLTAKFAFISPSKLVIAMPLLALLAITLLLLSVRRRPRVAPVWYGGRDQNPERVATTALTFSNALRTFTVSSIVPLSRWNANPCKTRTALPISPGDCSLLMTSRRFGPHLFAPLEKLVISLAARLRLIQSGHLNFYLSLIGALLVIILFIVHF
jgi:hydrogenase-4 component B